MGVAGTNAQLVAYANGAVAPFDPNNAKATAEHQKAIAEAGGVNFPFGVHATGVVVPHVYAPHPLVYGKRDADADAITPYDPYHTYTTNAHRPARFRFPYVYGKREAQIPVNLVTGYSHVGYPYFGYGVAPVVSPFVAHPNGALVPAEPKDVVDARAEHLAAHAVEKREAQIPVNLVTGYSAVAGLGYPYHIGYGVAPVVAPFVAHPNGALVP